MTEQPPAHIDKPDGHRIAYRATPGVPPWVVFCGGFTSDMTGTKAQFLERRCTAAGIGYVRFDYGGHGASDGRFEDGTIGLWADDALAVLGTVVPEPAVLVGSSMGAWIAVLVARGRPERVAGLVTVAAAPDFTEDLIRPRLDARQRRELAATGLTHRPSPYGPPDPITAALIEDGRSRLVLRDRIALTMPLRAMHGMADGDVPYATSLRLVDRWAGDDARALLIKDGDHRLSRDGDLAVLWQVIGEVRGRPAP